MKIDGKKIAEEIYARLREKPAPQTTLAVILVGENAASRIFIQRKEAAARSLHVSCAVHTFSATCALGMVVDCLRTLSTDNTVSGIVLQLPLPSQCNRDVCIAALDPKKDVDNLTGKAVVDAPAVGVVKTILQSAKCKVQNFGNILIVGKGLLVGGPIIGWLDNECKMQNAKCKIKVADSKTTNLVELVHEADLVITGVGKTGLIDPAWLKDGAGIIDFGTPADVLDSGFKIHDSRIGFYTPTPGGTGPLLVAKLFENFYILNN